jgi:hypothetical protein
MPFDLNVAFHTDNAIPLVIASLVASSQVYQRVSPRLDCGGSNGYLQVHSGDLIVASPAGVDA